MIGFIATLLIWCCIPQSCSKKPSEIEKKAIESLKADSAIKIQTDLIVLKYDSLIRVKQIEDSTHKAKIEKLSNKYYALRAVVNKLQTIPIDSAGQKIDIPVDVYNASIDSGNMCDSLLMYMDSELAVKDSIIAFRTAQFTAVNTLNKTHEQALSDLLALTNEEKSKRSKAQKLNNKIPLISVVSAFAGSILTILILK